jgi:transposase
MDKPIIDDELWKRIEPLLPQPKPRREKYPGRKPVPDRAALSGILFVLRTGLRWRDLPAEMGCGSGVTCWRRLRDWQEAGVWDRLHELLLGELRAAGQIDFSRVILDSSSVRAIGAAKNWAEPGRSCATGLQAPCRYRRKWGATLDHLDRCQSQ